MLFLIKQFTLTLAVQRSVFLRNLPLLLPLDSLVLYPLQGVNGREWCTLHPQFKQSFNSTDLHRDHSKVFTCVSDDHFKEVVTDFPVEVLQHLLRLGAFFKFRRHSRPDGVQTFLLDRSEGAVFHTFPQEHIVHLGMNQCFKFTSRSLSLCSQATFNAKEYNLPCTSVSC